MTPPYRYWPISERPPLTWPDGKRLAFYLGLNIEHFEMGRPSTSIVGVTAALPVDPLNYGWRDYGTRVGVWRMIDLLDRHELRASVLLNSDVCHEYPQIIRAGVERRWAWLAHGKNNSHFWTGLPLDTEREGIREIVETIATGTGTAPKGWLGPALTETPNTPAVLAEHGLTYILDWCNDDQPYPLNVPGHRIISVPYSIEVNDIPLFLDRGLTAPEFERIAIDQFDVLYEESVRRAGAVMSLSLHPFLINQPFRHKYLDRVLRHVRQHDDVWFTTSDDIADWYLERYYDAALEAQPGGSSAADDRESHA
jgi:peptidoglycan/xylan/chitin deacetylase (PgdA/CDA1 family)